MKNENQQMKDTLESVYPKNFPIGPGPIGEDRLNLILKRELKDWKIVSSKLPENPFITREELFKEYKFKNFDDVIEFMTKVSIGCNVFPHHPRWENTWTSLKVWLTTWDIEHIISYKDIMLARLMDKTFEAYKTVDENLHSKERVEKEREEFILNIRKLIGDDNLEEAFDKLHEFSILNRQNNNANELTLITARFNKTRNSERRGTIPREEAEIEYNRIRESVLEILDRK